MTRLPLLLLILCANYTSLAFRLGIRSSRSTLCVMLAGNGGSTSINLDPFEEDEERAGQLPEDAFGAGGGPLPSVSSRVNFAKETLDLKYDLWVVGAGTLGQIAAEQYKKRHPGSCVVAETKSVMRHDSMRAAGLTPRLREGRDEVDHKKAKSVIISLPPSSTEIYLEELNHATRLWAGPAGGGKLVFTSSTVVYGDSFGNKVTETFRTDSRSIRSSRMINAEQSILERDGIAVRLAGLYTESRGPVPYWIKNGTVDGTADGIVNMLHYADAAGVCLSILEKGVSGAIYLAHDDDPMTRQELCEAGLASGLFPGRSSPHFAQATAPQGKLCDGSWTRRQLGWAPTYPSFDRYMRCNIGGSTKYIPRKGSIAAREEKKSALWIPGGDDDDLLEL